MPMRRASLVGSQLASLTLPVVIIPTRNRTGTGAPRTSFAQPASLDIDTTILNIAWDLADDHRLVSITGWRSLMRLRSRNLMVMNLTSFGRIDLRQMSNSARS
ncbi:MAG: hypothetical protein CM15mP84_05800 [Cellvibrionales bacterium]|nr:MAG: hypothetical protein CM15mP84_05800 [Cellvibrionales bacterium]